MFVKKNIILYTMAKTIQDVVEEIMTEINNTDVTDEEKEVVLKIKALIRELRGAGTIGKDFRMYSADELSRIAGTLAILKASLAEIVPKAGRNKRLSEDILRLRKANLVDPMQRKAKELKEKPTAVDVTSLIDRQTFKDRVRYTFKEEYAEKMLYLWRSVNSILSVIEQRVKVLMSQGADARLLDSDVLDLDISDEVSEGDNPSEAII